MSPRTITPITLSIFKNLFAAICEEMGVTLARSAFSTNIKERKDFSCALFGPDGNMVAQAAHIPVHLGSMPLSVASAIEAFSVGARAYSAEADAPAAKAGSPRPPRGRKSGRGDPAPTLDPGDTVILNDPYRGGTHLPDITMVSPVFAKASTGKPAFYVANRAHHADVGGQSPGSMPLATHLEDEGVVIPPTLFHRRGRLNEGFMKDFLAQVRNPEERIADLHAQQAAIALGNRRLSELTGRYGLRYIHHVMHAYRDYEKKITLTAINQIPRGTYRFKDFLDDDGLGNRNISIPVTIQVRRNRIIVDLTDCDLQVAGPVNCPYAVTLSAVAYVFRTIVLALTGEDCLSLEPIELKTRSGTVVDAQYPAPVAGGNVETSQRIVDVLYGALAKALPKIVPAASQGTMNNLACGNENVSYYETLAGGMGGRPNAPGIDAIHTHMTNTMNTPIEALEKALPFRVTQYRIRKGSGGKGKHRGGDGLIREYEFLQDTRVSLLTERRMTSPYGLRGGKPGKRGVNWLLGKGNKKLPGKVELDIKKGERLRIETPGGGGIGKK